MIKDRLLTAEEIATIIDICSSQCDAFTCKFNECPLSGECLFFLTGDDSELKGEIK